MFELSKIVWFLVNPQTAAFWVLGLGVMLLFTRRWRLGRAIVGGMFALSIVTMALPTGTWAYQLLEYRFPQPTLPAHVDGIIVLGGEVDQEISLAYGQPNLGQGAARLLAFANLARRYPDARLVFTGGSGLLLNQAQTEAAVMPAALRAIGLDPDRVVLEARSRNTHENAAFTREMIDPQPGSTWLLITSAFHMPRAVGCFRRVGWNVIAYPVDYHTLPTGQSKFAIGFDVGFGALAAPIKEFIGLAVYRALGYTNALFPGP